MNARAELLPPEPMVPVPYRVVSHAQDTHDTATVALEPVDAALGPWAPGQFNMLWAFGVGEVPISISGGEGSGILHTVRAVGAVTAALCDRRPGDVVGVRGPFGTDWGVDAAAGHDVMVIAGGIGLAPLRPAIRQLVAQRERFGAVAVLVGARTPDELLFRTELEGWRARFDTDVAVTVDRATGGWRGRVGVVTKLVPRAAFEPSNTVALICGPEVMMRFAAQALLDRGVAPGDIRISMERNMQCAVGHCGHCQLMGEFVCQDGPVFSYDRVAPWLRVREL
ncbi:MAG: FAD/NAD(P)-binding protein [Acidimicrobiia bacterium]